jgi:hypothetical protein
VRQWQGVRLMIQRIVGQIITIDGRVRRKSDTAQITGGVCGSVLHKNKKA